MSVTGTDILVIIDVRGSHGLDKNCKELSTLFAMFLSNNFVPLVQPKATQMGQIGWKKKTILNSVHASVDINH